MAGLVDLMRNLKMRDGKINKGHSWKPFREDDITFQVIIFICDFHLMLSIWMFFITSICPRENVQSFVYLLSIFVFMIYNERISWF